MVELIAQTIIILSGLWLIAVSAIMFFRPKKAKEIIGKAASTNFINYAELTLRGIWGMSLLLYSDLSRFPKLFYYFGMVICITTIILFFTPRKLHARYSIFWSNKLTALQIRFCSVFSFILGTMLIYAVL